MCPESLLLRNSVAPDVMNDVFASRFVTFYLKNVSPEEKLRFQGHPN